MKIHYTLSSFLILLYSGIAYGQITGNTISGMDTAKSELSGVPSKDILKDIQTINLSKDYEMISQRAFTLPISDQNFGFIFKAVRLDSASLVVISKANLVSTISTCATIEGIENEDEVFSRDFDPSLASSTVFYICTGNYEDRNLTRIFFYIISNEEQTRFYLITFSLLNQHDDFIRAIDVALIRNWEPSTAHWGYHKWSNLFSADRILVYDDCWEYTPINPRGEKHKNIFTVSIANGGKIVIKSIK